MEAIDHAVCGHRAAPNMVLQGLAPHLRNGLAAQVEGPLGSSRRVRLTDPEGFLLSNDIISDIFALSPPTETLTPGAHEVSVS